MSDSIVEKISLETEIDCKKVAEIVTLALKELHMVSATDSKVTTGALIMCLDNFGPEAAYHLGGILAYHDDKTNDTIEPGYYSESLMGETMLRLLGRDPEIEDIKDKWFKYLKSQRQVRE